MIIKKIFSVIKREIKSFPEKRYIQAKKYKQRLTIENRGEKPRIFLFCAPIHSNLGDEAQLLCWLRLFKQWYPGHEIVPVSTKYRILETLRSIRNTIRPDDKLFIHSGYLFFDPHSELPFILDIIRVFYNYPITILPQTVNIRVEWMQRVIGRELDLHENLTLMCRDEVSYDKAKNLFKNVHLKLMPDVVTSLIGDKDYQGKCTKKEGVMFCLRDDMEKHYSEKDIQELIKRFSGYRIGRKDTTIKAPIWVWEKHREGLIKNIINELSTYKVVITDRYHGTILSATANTPVIVINSADHKLSSGVNWFKKCGINTVQYAATLEEATVMALQILRSKTSISNPPSFKEKYWNLEAFESEACR